MLLALAICDRDILQAERLVKWIGFLSEQDGGSMKEKEILLAIARTVDSERAANLSKLSREIFQRVTEIEMEDPGCGWPGAANFMFSGVLLAIEGHYKAPAFFLEPDGIPLVPEWFYCIEKAYEVHGKPFLGGYVPTPPPHMTGIAVYPPDWRTYAPSLVRVPDSAGWDTYCADQVNPNCHFTPLIQHIFKRHEPGWSIPGLNALDKRAVIFHQDKQGKLIRLLDEANFGGACARHSLFSYTTDTADERVMIKFYSTVNATKAIVSNSGKRFLFDPVESFAGSVPGVYASENPGDQQLLDDLAQNPTTGVREIDQKEWERLAKKNWSHPVLATLRRSDGTSLWPTNGLLNRPRPAQQMQTPITPTPSRKAAEVVAEPLSTAGDPTAPPGLAQIKDINEVLRVDNVQPAQPAAEPMKKAKRAKKG
jgi:hypothetical protein